MIVYQLQNTVNGKSYIGITNGSVETRWRTHVLAFKRLEKLKARMPKLYYAFRKYGTECWEKIVLFETDDLEALKTKEMELIASMKTLSGGYNIQRGGDTGNAGVTLDGEWRGKIKSRRLLYWKTENGKAWAGELSEKMKGNKYGKLRKKTTFEPEALAKMREAKLGNTRPIEARLKQGVSLTKAWAEGAFDNRAPTVTKESIQKGIATRKANDFKQTQHQKDSVRVANQKVWEVTFPDGHVEIITNLRQFCLDRGLDQGNLSKTQKTGGKHKGYSAKKKGG